MNSTIFDSRWLNNISFISPFLSGNRFLNLHLSSIRRFHPHAEIIISGYEGRGREISEKYGAKYSNENLDYYAAVESLFDRASNDIIVLSDCNTVLFTNVDFLADKLKSYDIVGIEEKIKNPFLNNWERYAPGYMDLTFFMFSKEKFKSKIPDWPKMPHWESNGNPKIINMEPHYGLCELFPKHYYLRPYLTKKYGLGNLIMDKEKPVLYHQWYSSWEARGTFMSETTPEVNPIPTWEILWDTENKFFEDYPNPDFSGIRKAF